MAAVVSLDAETPTPSADFHPDIEYGQAGNEKLLLDAHIPAGTGPFPIAILVHGGGWNSGSKAGDITPLLAPLTAANFTWFSIDYRLAPQHPWPACLEDLQTAIRWVRAHAAEYHGDPHRIALIGYSAGGHLVCMAATHATDDTRVQAVVGLAAPTDHPADTELRGGLSKSLQDLLGRPKLVDAETQKILEDLSPLYHVQPGLPPFLLLQGTADKTVLPSQSVNLAAKLKEHQVPCLLISVPGAPHRLSEWEKFDPSYQAQMIAWLQQTLGEEKPPTGEGK